MNEQNLIPGKHKLTVEEQSRAGQASGVSRKRNAALKKLVKSVSGMMAPDDIRATMALMGIPEDEQTMLMASVVAMSVLAARGDKDARRDQFKYLGEDPEEKRKDEELKLKKAEAERKNPETATGTTVLEQMVRELYERPDGEAEEIHD